MGLTALEWPLWTSNRYNGYFTTEIPTLFTGYESFAIANILDKLLESELFRLILLSAISMAGKKLFAINVLIAVLRQVLRLADFVDLEWLSVYNMTNSDYFC